LLLSADCPKDNRAERGIFDYYHRYLSVEQRKFDITPAAVSYAVKRDEKNSEGRGLSTGRSNYFNIYGCPLFHAEVGRDGSACSQKAAFDIPPTDRQKVGLAYKFRLLVDQKRDLPNR